jgi:hypothetical protein
MKVKIIKSNKETMWYVNHIGEEFEVISNSKVPVIHFDDMYRIKQRNVYSPSFIYIEDCEILKNE